MVMDTVQVRLSHGLIEMIDNFVKTGIYANRSDVIRDSVRRMVLEQQVGTIPNTGNSVNEIRKIREKLSSEKVDLDEINKLAD